MASRGPLSAWCLAIFCAVLAAVNAPQAALGQPRWEPERIGEVTPQFVATAVRFKALNETGPDWPGSDEVYAVFAVFNPNIDRPTSTYGNIDTGDTQTISGSEACIAPQPGCGRGVPNLHFTVALWEEDEPPFWVVEFTPGCIANSHCYSRGKDQFDEFIGRAEVNMSRQQLVADLPTIGAIKEYTIKPAGGRGDYEFTYRVLRLSDVGTRLVVAPPTAPAIALAASVSYATSPATVTLNWSGVPGTLVDIHHNGVRLGDTVNDGNWAYPFAPGTHAFKVCERLSSNCSADVSVTVTQ